MVVRLHADRRDAVFAASDSQTRTAWQKTLKEIADRTYRLG
jgi:hypothetical protein